MGLLHTLNTTLSDDVLERRTWKALETELCPRASKEIKPKIHLHVVTITSHNALYYCVLAGRSYGFYFVLCNSDVLKCM